jgi:putative membrane protein
MLMYVANYVIYLLSGAFLLGIFFVIYTRTTPIDEVAQIRGGNSAAALSLAGALIGFSLTVASGILHNSALLGFLAWSAGAMVVQLAVYTVFSRLLPGVKQQIEAGNVAMGGLLGAISLSVGAINAACLS